MQPCLSYEYLIYIIYLTYNSTLKLKGARTSLEASIMSTAKN